MRGRSRASHARTKPHATIRAALVLARLMAALLLAACGSAGSDSAVVDIERRHEHAAPRHAGYEHARPRPPARPPRRPRPRPRPRARPRAERPTCRSRSSASRAGWVTARSVFGCATRAPRAAARTGTRASCSLTSTAGRCPRSRTTPPTTSSARTPAAPLVIAPGASASFRLDVGHGVATANGCATAYGLQVIPPNDTATLRTTIPNGAYECRDANVSPLRAGASAYP